MKNNFTIVLKGNLDVGTDNIDVSYNRIKLKGMSLALIYVLLAQAVEVWLQDEDSALKRGDLVGLLDEISVDFLYKHKMGGN